MLKHKHNHVMGDHTCGDKGLGVGIVHFNIIITFNIIFQKCFNQLSLWMTLFDLNSINTDKFHVSLLKPFTKVTLAF